MGALERLSKISEGVFTLKKYIDLSHYQTYSNGAKDAICHAWSVDGLHFTRDASNPIFSPEGDWNNGRAIDAEVALWNSEYYLYFASRTPDGVKQILGVA